MRFSFETSECVRPRQASFAPDHPDDRTKDDHDADCDQPGHECENDAGTSSAIAVVAEIVRLQIT
jgi:hypothetical protein